jgi:hypothetical protein
MKGSTICSHSVFVRTEAYSRSRRAKTSRSSNGGNHALKADLAYYGTRDRAGRRAERLGRFPSSRPDTLKLRLELAGD